MFRPGAGASHIDFPLISGAGGPGFSDFIELLGRTIAFHPEMARMLGSRNAALFLQQLMWWAPKSKDPDGWVYKTAVAWTDETSLTYKEQRLARRTLVGLGVMEERNNRLEHRLYYRVVRKTLDDLWAKRAVDQRAVREVTKGQFGKVPSVSSVVPVEDLQEKTSRDSKLQAPGRVPGHPVVSKPARKASKKSTPRSTAPRGRRTSRLKADPKRRPEESPPVPPLAAAQSDPFLVAGFDHLWVTIPKRISTGTAKVEAWEVWKTLKPVPNRRHVAEMVRILEGFLEEETDYAFYEIDGTVKVTPAMLIGFLCKAMNEGSPLRKVVDEEVTV